MEQICDKIVCLPKDAPKETWRLFFGDTGHIVRSDKVDYKTFQTLYEKAFADFWTWKVVDFSQDSVGWERIDEVGRRMFLLNNAFQTLMDSGVFNDYFGLLPLTTNGELATLYSSIGLQEVIHANSYSYGLAQMFGANVDDKFNLLYKDEFIRKRMESEIDFASKLQKEAQKGVVTDKLKMLLLMTIFSAYYLESVKFPHSFTVSWKINDAFGYAIQGFAQVLKLIAYDEETTHRVANINVLKILMREERQGFLHLKSEFENFVYNYVQEQVNQELLWAEYLHKDGSIKGYTYQVAEQFIKYKADECLRRIGFQSIYNIKKPEIIDWYNKYYDINNQNNANQELSNVSYQKGGVKNDLNKFDNFKF